MKKPTLLDPEQPVQVIRTLQSSGPRDRRLVQQLVRQGKRTLSVTRTINRRGNTVRMGPAFDLTD